MKIFCCCKYWVGKFGFGMLKSKQVLKMIFKPDLQATIIHYQNAKVCFINIKITKFPSYCCYT